MFFTFIFSSHNVFSFLSSSSDPPPHVLLLYVLVLMSSCSYPTLHVLLLMSITFMSASSCPSTLCPPPQVLNLHVLLLMFFTFMSSSSCPSPSCPPPPVLHLHFLLLKSFICMVFNFWCSSLVNYSSCSAPSSSSSIGPALIIIFIMPYSILFLIPSLVKLFHNPHALIHPLFPPHALLTHDLLLHILLPISYSLMSNGPPPSLAFCLWSCVSLSLLGKSFHARNLTVQCAC